MTKKLQNASLLVAVLAFFAFAVLAQRSYGAEKGQKPGKTALSTETVQSGTTIFGGLTWGADVATVKKTFTIVTEEPVEIKEREGVKRETQRLLAEKTTIPGIYLRDVTPAFSFEAGKLVGVELIIDPWAKYKSIVTSEFDDTTYELLVRLKRKYGEPTMERPGAGGGSSYHWYLKDTTIKLSTFRNFNQHFVNYSRIQEDQL